MSRNLWAIVVVVLGLCGGTALLLANRDTFQKLGEPGVKLVSAPTVDVRGEVVRETSVYLPEVVLDYSSSNAPIADVELDWLPGDTTYGRRLYFDPAGFGLQLSVVLMGTDRTSIHKPQFCLTGVGWSILETTQTHVPIASPHPYDLPVIRMHAEKNMTTADGVSMNVSAIYVYWFVADGVVTAEHNARMLGILKDLPKGVLQRWAYVSTFAVCMPGEEEQAFERVANFIAAAVPTFQVATGPGKPAGL